MRQLHLPRVIRVVPPRQVARTAALAFVPDHAFRSGCACGWIGAVWSSANEAYDGSIKHFTMHDQTCADCGDVREAVLWEKDAHSWVLCPVCAKRRAGQELRVLQAELAV